MIHFAATWIAATKSSDVVAILIFATVLFLILFGIVSLVKWIVRLIGRKPNPAKVQTAILVFDSESRADDEDEEDEELVRFARFLHSKLSGKNAGRFAGSIAGDGESLLCFEGPDANRIWEILSDDVKDCAPVRPLRVILRQTRKKSGERTIDPVPWHPVRQFDYQEPAETEIPEKGLRLSWYGERLSITGIIGISGWNILRNCSGKSENEFRDTPLGDVSAYLVGGILVLGLSMTLISSLRIRALTKSEDSMSWETPMENSLKYVLLIVIAIFGLILFLI